MNKYIFASSRGADFEAEGNTPEEAWKNLCKIEINNGSLWKTQDRFRNEKAVMNQGFTPFDRNDFTKPVWKLVENQPQPQFSTLLKLLLVASKNRHKETFNIAFVGDVLANEYHKDMRAKDAFHLCLEAFMEALKYKQFEIPYRHDPVHVMEELFSSPTKIYGKIWEHGGMWADLRDSITFEEYYNCLINHILRIFMLTNISWCREQLPELNRNANKTDTNTIN